MMVTFRPVRVGNRGWIPATSMRSCQGGWHTLLRFFLPLKYRVGAPSFLRGFFWFLASEERWDSNAASPHYNFTSAASLPAASPVATAAELLAATSAVEWTD